MTDVIQQLQEAADKATQASAQANAWANGGVGVTVPTDSGPVPTIAEFTRANQAKADVAIEALGWVLAGDFTVGCTVTDRNQYVLVVGGSSYRWDGVLPKVVPPGSSPTPISAGSWVLVGDATLRGELANSDGSELVGFQQSGTGAVARTAESKLMEFTSIDDYVDISAANSNATADGGRTIFFPNGPYEFVGTPSPGVTYRFTGNPIDRTLLGGAQNFKASSASYAYLSGPHVGLQKTAEYIRVLAQGSGNIGQQYCDAALNLHIQKEHWSETSGVPAAGEIDGLNITYRQGGPRVGGGDPLAGISSGAAILCNTQATDGAGATQILEAVNSVVDVPGLTINRQIGLQLGMINTRDNDYYGVVAISTTGTQDAAFHAISQTSSSWGNLIQSQVGSFIPYFIRVDGYMRWRTSNSVNVSIEQESSSGDLVFKNNGGTEIFRVGQTRTTSIPNSPRVDVSTTATISQSDHQRIVTLANAAAITCTLSATAAAGTTVRVIQRDPGQVTFIPASGALLRNISSHTKTAGQGAVVTLEVYANSGGSSAIWYLSGSTA